jgi:hypothetical protein
MAVMLAIMLVMVKRAVDLSFRHMAATHLHPLGIGVVVVGVGLTLRASLGDIPGPLLLAITLGVLLASSFPVLLLHKRRVLGSYNVALLRRTEGGL